MDYKEKYEQALERARELSKTVTGANYEYIFPELKESEEERIKKALIKILNEIVINTNYKELGIDYNIRDMIAWLEKQGEQKSAESTKDYNDIDPHFGIPAEDLMSTDKAESKFKDGNWYQCTKDFFGKGVTFDKNTAYYCAKEGCLLNRCHIAIVKDLYDNFKLWTIQDAKDGDVLLEEETGEPFIYNGNRATYFSGYFLGAYCGIYNGEFNPYGNIHHWGKNSCPATKEQRDLLFQKMKEAGYEWDSEKKELRNIKPKTLDADNEIKELFKKSSQNYYKAISEVREMASAYLKEIVCSKGGKITDDDDELLEGIAVAYDGGNHPEYASSVVCPLLSIVLNNKDELEFNVEDEDGLDLSRITTEDLIYITDTFSKLI